MFKKVIFTGAMLVSALSAHAASTAPFGVTGTITPAACDVTLTGGAINLGSVSTVLVRAYTLYNGAYYAPYVTVPFSVICSAPSRVEVAFLDNRAGKIISIDSNDAFRFGMVDGSGTAAIGSYEMYMSNVLIDGVAVGKFLSTPNGTTAWSATAPNAAPASYTAPGYTNGFAKLAAATVPDSLTTLAGNLNARIWFNAAYIQSATNAITPNGSGTMSLVYL